MTLYKCQCPNGEVIVLLAASTRDAVRRLNVMAKRGTVTVDMVSEMPKFFLSFRGRSFENEKGEADYRWEPERLPGGVAIELGNAKRSSEESWHWREALDDDM